MSIIEKARIFATAAHAAVDQSRKYTGEPYINHPREVADLVGAVSGDNPEMVAAAWLHDCVEDTGVSLDLIYIEFGQIVGDLVAGLTDVSSPEDGTRAARKAANRAHIAKQPPACKTIKLADLVSNTKTVVERDPEFAKVYLQEKLLLLEVLRDGDAGLWAEAERIARLGLSDLIGQNGNGGEHCGGSFGERWLMEFGLIDCGEAAADRAAQGRVPGARQASRACGGGQGKAEQADEGAGE